MQTRAQEMIDVGDIVILKNEGTPRIFWKLAEVEELIPSSDKISVLNETDKRIVHLRRRMQHLVPLEINRESVKSDMNNDK